MREKQKQIHNRIGGLQFNDKRRKSNRRKTNSTTTAHSSSREVEGRQKTTTRAPDCPSRSRARGRCLGLGVATSRTGRKRRAKSNKSGRSSAREGGRKPCRVEARTAPPRAGTKGRGAATRRRWSHRASKRTQASEANGGRGTGSLQSDGPGALGPAGWKGQEGSELWMGVWGTTGAKGTNGKVKRGRQT